MMSKIVNELIALAQCWQKWRKKIVSNMARMQFLFRNQNSSRWRRTRVYMRDKKAIKSSWITTFNNLYVCTDGFFSDSIGILIVYWIECVCSRMRSIIFTRKQHVFIYSIHFIIIIFSSVSLFSYFISCVCVYDAEKSLQSTYSVCVIIITLVRQRFNSRLECSYDSSVVHVTIVPYASVSLSMSEFFCHAHNLDSIIIN